MSNPEPISDIVKLILEQQKRGMLPSTVKLRQDTLDQIFESEEAKDLKLAPSAASLAKHLSEATCDDIRVIVDGDAAPDKVYVML